MAFVLFFCDTISRLLQHQRHSYIDKQDTLWNFFPAGLYSGVFKYYLVGGGGGKILYFYHCITGNLPVLWKDEMDHSFLFYNHDRCFDIQDLSYFRFCLLRPVEISLSTAFAGWCTLCRHYHFLLSYLQKRSFDPVCFGAYVCYNDSCCGHLISAYLFFIHWSVYFFGGIYLCLFILCNYSDLIPCLWKENRTNRLFENWIPGSCNCENRLLFIFYLPLSYHSGFFCSESFPKAGLGPCSYFYSLYHFFDCYNWRRNSDVENYRVTSSEITG